MMKVRRAEITVEELLRRYTAGEQNFIKVYIYFLLFYLRIISLFLLVLSLINFQVC